ncbi:uncharacterized protein LOC101898442 [Musca domestica]|uniref:Uncharacterized protein LOC101898442 n=1 Tax=Musca domestica TaxID=7370 RepID=A0ABM3V622_MUSDO|nr:uncharacterized protein LOC101898442 [Musca domestica]
MFNSFKISLIGLLLLHSACTLRAESLDIDEKPAGDVTTAKDDVESKVADISLTNVNDEKVVTKIQTQNEQLTFDQMPLIVEEKEGILKEIVAEGKEEKPSQDKEENPSQVKEENHSQDKEENEAPPSPLNENNGHETSLNRTSRQLFYSPNFFYIQNIGAEGSRCITSRGLVGICMGFDRCALESGNQRRRRHLTYYSLAQYPYFTPYIQPQPQSDELCTYFDQYARTSSGVCCTSIDNIIPIVPGETPTFQPGLTPIPSYPNPTPAQPEATTTVKPENDEPSKDVTMDPMDVIKETESSEDSDVIEPPANFNYEPEPPKYDEPSSQEGNNIGYDPIDESLKQAPNYNNFIRYPWPSQFVGFSGVQQWPPPLPTHPPSAQQWPPPLPTHPPNHHYPTHPPSTIGGQFVPVTTKRPITTLTTKRPTYPTYRPVTTTTTTTTTRRPPSSSGSGTSSNGLPLQCGVIGPDQERIVGGTNASPNEFPWIAVIFKSGKQFCGGSLITNNHVLTAAHCVARMTSWDVAAMTVHLGDYNIRTDYEVQHISRRVKRLVRHKGFDFSTLHNDIAILTLSEPVKFTKEIQPICLPTSPTQQRSSYSGQIATVAGWGSLRENGPQPSILQKVQIPIWNNAECAAKYGRAAPAGIIESMVCAGQAAKDSCSGDSGGPMIVNEGGRFVQVGIVSWGIGCGKGQYPGVYTRVTSLLPWIYKNIK